MTKIKIEFSKVELDHLDLLLGAGYADGDYEENLDRPQSRILRKAWNKIITARAELYQKEQDKHAK